MRPRVAQSADPDGWSGAWSADPTAHPAIQKSLGDALADEGQVLELMALDANRAEVRIRNNRYMQRAEAIGRTARLMTRALPPSVETLVITSSEDGLPTTSITLRRSDVERLENTEASQIANVAVSGNADPRPGNLVRTPGMFPRFSWAPKPIFRPRSSTRTSPSATRSTPARGRIRVDARPDPGRQRPPARLRNQKQEAPGNMTVEEYEALDSDYDENGVPRVRSDGRMYQGK